MKNKYYVDSLILILIVLILAIWFVAIHLYPKVIPVAIPKVLQMPKKILPVPPAQDSYCLSHTCKG